MKKYSPRDVADAAVSTRPTAPATAILHDSDDVRMIVFRLEPMQVVAPHTSPSSVVLTVLTGTGVILGPDGDVSATVGDVVAYEPRELHGMRALDERFDLLAIIAPRPGART